MHKHQVSLQQFLELFDHAIDHSEKVPLCSLRRYSLRLYLL